MRTAVTLAAAFGLAGLAMVGPALAVPAGVPVVAVAPAPDFTEASTFRTDHAEHDVRHYPACVGQMNGTAHHSCGTLSGGPAGGLF